SDTPHGRTVPAVARPRPRSHPIQWWRPGGRRGSRRPHANRFHRVSAGVAPSQGRQLACACGLKQDALKGAADVPTIAEAGYPDLGGVGVFFPAGTPKEIVTVLNREIIKIVALPDMKESLATLGYEPAASTPEEFAKRIKIELETWGKVIRAVKIK